ncbi:nestin isoform X3 [Nannospalax galili]|uniref:nestin isoform X3 n=1 Tax=Nannospalax galili TaxID=1026970 RepID=UPI00081A156C|nr:nestin isoform X3 [Nannospalax galili]
MNSLAPSQDSKSLGLLPPHPSLVEPFLFTKLRGPRPSRVPRVRPPSGRQQSRMEGCVGEESFQLWELNRRLEAYLSRVKALEEQNELLSGELRGLRAQSGDASWRARADDELAALRALVDERWREKHAAEVERDNLAEELEGVAGRCQQLLLARERTAEEAACSRRAVEAEQCAQGWLSTQAADLERELEAMRAAHEEERAYLHAQVSCAPREPPALPRGPPGRVPEVEELARRLGDEWRGAVRGYQERVAHMESSLGQARERLGRAVQGARESRRELQQLQAERSGLQERRAALQRRLEGCWQDRLRATEKFQLAVEALEQEKQGLQSQIAQVLEGRQQLAHLKMSLSLEVATYRTLLEAENSRLQTPGFGSQASLDFQEPKLQLHFLGTPEGHRLGPVLPVLSPTPLPSLLPYTLETPEPVFLKTQEFLQAHTPTLASTPIPPTPQALCPATNAEVRAQDAPLSLLQTQGGKPQTPEPRWDEAKVAVPASNLLGLEEPGGKQLVASTGHFPEDQAALAPSVNFDQPTLEAKDGEPNGSRVSIIFQEDEGQILELVEKEAAIEVKVESSLGQETREEGGLEEIQDFQDPLGKETLKAVGEEPLISLKIQGHEAPGKENLKSLRSIEENSETLKSLEKVKQTLLKPLEEKDMEAEGILEKEVPELPNLGKEDLRIVDQELVTSPEGTLETVSFLGKENQRVEGYPDENIESFKKSQHLLGYQEAVNHETLRSPTNEDQEPLRSVEEEEQVIVKPLERENQEPLKSLEEEEQVIVKPLERENQEPLKSLEEEEQVIVRPPEKENRELLGSAEEDERIVEPLEVVNKESLGYLKEEEQVIVKPLEKENQEPLRSLEEEEQVIGRLIEKENPEPLRSLEEEEEVIVKPLEKDNQEPLRSLEEEGQVIVKPLERENQEPLNSLEEQVIGRLIEKENPEPLRSLEEEEEVIVKPLEKDNQEPLRSLEEEGQVIVKPLERENQEPLNSLEEQVIGRLIEKENPEPLRSLEEEEEVIVKPLEKENQEPLRSLEEEEQVIVKPLERENQEPLKSLEEEEQVIVKPLERENQEPLKSLEEEEQVIGRLIEKENPEPWRSLEEEEEVIVKPLEKENQEPLRSLEDNNQEPFRPLEKEIQESLRSLEEEEQVTEMLKKEDQYSLKSLGDEDQVIFRPLEKENQESLRSLGEQGQEIQRFLEQAAPQTLSAVEKEDQMAVRSPEKVNPGLLQSLGNNQEIVSFLEKENQELLTPLKESIETVQSLETEDLEPLKIIGEKDLEILNSLEAQKSLWSVGEMNRETMKPLENEIQKPLEYVEENEETPHPLEKENQDLRSLHKWDLETVQSPEWAEKESQQHLEVEECLEVGENLELLRSLEEGQELLMSAHQLRWKDMVEDQALGQDLPLGRTGMDSEDQEKLYLSGQGGKEEVKEQGGLQLDATGEAWRPGSPEPKERRIPAEEASRKEDQLEQMGTPGLPTAQGKPKVTELVLEDEDIARGGDHASLEVTLGSEATRGWSAAEAGLGLTQEVVGLGDPGHLAREEAIQPPLREECLEVERVQDLEGPGKDRKEAEFLEWPKTSRDPLEPPKHCEVPEPVASWGEEEALAAEISGHEGSDSSPSRPPETEENEVAEPELGLPDSRPTESHLPTLVLEDALGLQPQGEGSREAGWGQAEALEGVEAEQQFGPGEDSEALQDWEESKEDSEADELGETLPDSTPLGFYLSSPTSPPWDLAGQQRLSPQGEATKKGWDPAVLGPQGLGVPFSDEDVEEEQGHDSDLSEEFEDLGTETSLLPGVPREVAEPLGQVPPLLESACWDQGGESDGFADEEESGEEGEDEEHKAGMELGVQWWGPGPTVGGLQAQDRFQRGNIQEHEAVGVSGPWDDSLSGAEADVSVTALEIKSQDAAEPSGSEESDSVSLEMEDQMSGREVKGIGTWVGSTSGINGQGPNLEESEHVNGRVINGLELSEGQGTHGDQDEGLPLQEEEGSTLKTPWVGSPVHLVPSQFPKYPPREADRDSWSSGED